MNARKYLFPKGWKIVRGKMVQKAEFIFQELFLHSLLVENDTAAQYQAFLFYKCSKTFIVNLTYNHYFCS